METFMQNKIIFISLLLCLGTTFAYAAEFVVNKDLNSFFKATPQKNANATCFMYPNNQYKCACRFSTNKKIWASKDPSLIQGLSTGMKSGIIEECSK